MAKITKSPLAAVTPIHVTMGAAEFNLTDADSVYVTDDPAIIANAMLNQNLHVELDPIKVEDAPAARDMSDPHQNPAADHLSAVASPEAVAAAEANEAKIKEVVGGDLHGAGEAPTTAETVADTMRIAGVREAPTSATPPPEAPGNSTVMPVAAAPEPAPVFSTGGSN